MGHWGWQKNFRELRIAPTLAMSVGCMVLLPVGLVLYLHWNTNRKFMPKLAARLMLRNLEAILMHVDDEVLRCGRGRAHQGQSLLRVTSGTSLPRLRASALVRLQEHCVAGVHQ